MKKLILMAVLPMIIFISGCSKDQKVVRQLDGEWKINSMTKDGNAADKEDYQYTTYIFTKCKVSKGDCDGSVKYSDPSKGSFTFPFKYNISEKGEKITIKTTSGNETETTEGTILEHSKSKFVYSFEESEADENGNPFMHKYVVTLEKI
ncbi:MAG: hypothetical protein M3Q58_08640 [Bacteroidota bacterium]|nr:hypothetical protein [Bacteroidota bacterium]